MQPYELRIAPTARCSLARIPISYAVAIIEVMGGALCESPHRIGKPMHNELAGLFSARCGAYRVLYRIDDEARVVDVERIDHRSDIYRPR